ncbi:MAG: hypothetical protein ACRDZ4_13810 [Egibacteraceae bacterium]
MSERMTKGEIDRIGDRLRATGPITQEDLRALQALRSQHADALDSAAAILRERLQLRPTRRLKTVNTLVEKLQRQRSMRLSRMQDIAGMRVVLPGTRDDQDRVVEQICSQFERAKVIDRRANPSCGYRAVHVIVQVAGLQRGGPGADRAPGPLGAAGGAPCRLVGQASPLRRATQRAPHPI